MLKFPSSSINIERIDPLISSKKLLEKCPQLWQTNLFGQP